MKPYSTLSTSTVFENKWWKYYRDEYVLPNGQTGEYHYVSTYGSVFVIPQLEDDVFVLTSQFRYLNRRQSVEFPGGGMVRHLSPEENARKELREETGFEAEILEKIGEFNPYNGVTNEICHVFIAKNICQFSQELEESEEITLLRKSKKEIGEMIRSGSLWDGMTLAAWMIYLQHQ